MIDTASFVIMIDIVGFSEKEGDDQANCVNIFLKILQESINLFENIEFNIFPIGDGAIICLYEKNPSYKRKIGELPLIFAKQILKLNKENDFKLRISINYSSIERIINVGGFKSINTKHIQIGDGINIAERIINFCEPDEIMISEVYYKILRDFKYLKKYSFIPHRDVFVKHMQNLNIFSYIPSSEEKGYIYNIPERHQDIKRYAYFPPIKNEIFNKVKKFNLEGDLRDICSYSYETLASINRDHIFMSWNSIYQTLKKIPNREEEVLVISREDLPHDFWSTPEAQSYLSYLENEKKMGKFNQFRISIYDPQINEKEKSTPVHIIKRLYKLHRPGCFKKIDKEIIGYNILTKYIFGLTIFPKLKFVIAPLPVFISYDEYINNIRFAKNIDDIFGQYSNIDFSKTHFKALIIANEKKVTDLIYYFNLLKEDDKLEDYII